jgi:AraC-like DNA-binding protein
VKARVAVHGQKKRPYVKRLGNPNGAAALQRDPAKLKLGQAQSVEPENALETSKHLDLLSLTTRDGVGLGLGDRASPSYCALMDDSAFGLHLAKQIDPRDVGMYFYAGSAARDPGEALALFSRYCRIVNEAFRLTQRSADSALVFEYVGLPRYAARHNMEYVVAAIAAALRTMSGRKLVPAKVAFAHNRNSDVREFEWFFGCPVEFGAPNTVFQISADALRLPLITADPKLLRVLRPYCDAAAKERNIKPGTLRSAVEAEVEKLLPHGKAKAENVAEALALSLRTLARRLADEGTTYGEVVDQLRKSLATQYLNDPGMSLGQVAWLLGYEGSTSFNHAFKRWTGRSPSADRNK